MSRPESPFRSYGPRHLYDWIRTYGHWQRRDRPLVGLRRLVQDPDNRLREVS